MLGLRGSAAPPERKKRVLAGTGEGIKISQMKAITYLTILALTCAVGCMPSVRVTSSASETVTSHGITFHLPSQKSSSVDESSDGFAYKGDTMTIVETNGALTVNGTSFGTVKSGDTVDIDSSGAVVVNGTRRDGK